MTQSDMIVNIAIVLAVVIAIFPFWLDYTFMNYDYRKQLKYDRKHPTRKKKKPTQHKTKSGSKILEPYDTKSYWNNPINTDIQGFIESYNRKH